MTEPPICTLTAAHRIGTYAVAHGLDPRVFLSLYSGYRQIVGMGIDQAEERVFRMMRERVGEYNAGN